MPAVRSTRAFFVTLLATAFAVLAVFCALPDDRYLRFQSLTDSAVVKAGWIYERIHFDPSPIDTVIIGTSHSVFGINSAEVEQACAAGGGGKCATVNFALQHLGRNLHWLVAREALRSRKPRLLIIEVQDSEPRAMHPAFPYLADASDIVSAPLVINTSFFPDLVRLPFRQFSLFIKGVVPGLFDARTRFDPALYRGPHWDDTFSEAGSIERPVAHPQPRTGIHSAAELEDERAHSQITQGAPKLPASLRPLEYRANLIYLEKIVALAREKGVEVRFLYMPTFHGPSAPEFDAFYGKFAPVWHLPEQIVARPELWLDVGHFNTTGADLVSRWLGAKIADDAHGLK